MKLFRFLAPLVIVVNCFTGYSLTAASLHVWQDSPSPMPPYTNWATAAHQIQDAVDAALTGDTVVVTNGIYTTGGRAVFGAMTNRVAIDRAIRVESVNGPGVTMIVGAESRDSDGVTGDGAIRCVYLGTNAAVVGFTLTNGHTRGYGARWLLEERGGGVWSESSGTVSNCVIVGNAANAGGGGVYRGTLYNCVISSNRLQFTGYVGLGGGVYGATLYDCELTFNEAHSGGGAWESTLYNCVIENNRAIGGGTDEWDPSGSGGGVANCTNYNSVLTANHADSFGGGALGGLLFNCTLTRNTAGRAGGGLSVDVWGTTVRAGNCIIYHNVAPTGLNHSGESSWPNLELNHSCTTPLPSSGTNNIEADPQLITTSHIAATSPCVDGGNSAYVVGADIDGQPWRIPPSIGADQVSPGSSFGDLEMWIDVEHTSVSTGFAEDLVARSRGSVVASVWDFGDGTVVSNRAVVAHSWGNAGTYEVRLTGYNDSFPDGVTVTTLVEVVDFLYYVDQANLNPAFPYTSRNTAATNIQDAIDAAVVGSTVLVGDGHYRTGTHLVDDLWNGWTSNRIALDKPIVVRSENGPDGAVILGESSPTQYSRDGVRGAYVGAGAVLSGFTILDGEAERGGGVYLSSSGVLTNCVLMGNEAYGGAGAFGGKLMSCVLSNNFGVGAGSSELTDCDVLDNSDRGVSDSVVFNCRIRGNRGGGAWNSTLYNSLLTENQTLGEGGGAIYSTLYNCSVIANTARQRRGGGVYQCTLYNSICYFNEAILGANYDDGSTLMFSCTTPLPESGSGNIDADPGLATLSHLSADSPCVGAGSSEFASGVDIDGEPWASPPSIGVDELREFAVGPVRMSMDLSYTNVGVGFPVAFRGDNEGSIIESAWDFGDGNTLTNKPFAAHSWNRAGNYVVRFIGFNDEVPLGVYVEKIVTVSDSIHYVNQANPNPIFPFSTWETAATHIQDAVNAAHAGGLVLVADGVYSNGAVAVPDWGSNRVALTRPVSVRSVNGPDVTTILGVGVPGEWNDSNAMRCVFVGDGAELAGFTLSNGHALSGGGAAGEGGGRVSDCIILGNSAGSGAGAYRLRVRQSIIATNWASAGGGVSGCELFNCVLRGNRATNSGAGSYLSTLFNCTVVGNFAGNNGGAVNRTKCFNSIVYSNNYFNQNNYSSSTFSYSCSAPLPSGPGNISSAPGFTDLGQGDLRLRSDSPCIDRGTNLTGVVLGDFTGGPRPLDGDGDGTVAFDMGAYEFNLRSFIPDAWFDRYSLDDSDPHVAYLNPDGDPSTTYQEWMADTDPTNALSFFRIESIETGAQVAVGFHSSLDRIYTLLRAPRIPLSGSAMDWTPVPGQVVIPGTGNVLTLIDNVADSRTFYRVRVALP